MSRRWVARPSSPNAIAGISGDGLVNIDYVASVADVYSQLTVVEIKASKSLYPAVWAGSGITSSERQKYIDLPTWVPDFESRNPDYT